MKIVFNNEYKNLCSDFCRFQEKFTQGKKQDKTFFVTHIKAFENKYKNAGFGRIFANEIFNFAINMEKMGMRDFPGIIYSNLIKMPFIQPKQKEVYIKKGLDFAKEQGDYIHVLSRLVDLEILYKQTNRAHKCIDVLFLQEKALIKICNNFKYAKKSYKTYLREHGSLRQYEMELAKKRTDIAKIMIRKNPELTKVVLEKARKTFELENRTKEVQFVDNMLAQIKNNKAKMKIKDQNEHLFVTNA